MRPRRVAASCSRPGSAMITIGRSWLSTVPAHVAYCPPRPTLRLPARCAAANSAGSRVSRICPPTSLQREQLIQRHRVDFARQRLVQRRPLLAVQHGVVGEVGGRVGLIGGHQIDERRLGHRLQRVVRRGAARRWSRPSPCRAPCRTASRRRARDRRGSASGSGSSLVAERVVEQAAEIGGRPAERRAQIGTADVADKQRVAGQHGVRLGVALDRGRRPRSRSTPACARASRSPAAAPVPTRCGRRRRAA